MRQLFPAIALLTTCGVATTASAATFQFDLGHNSQTTADTGWNNMTGGNGQVPNDVIDAVDATGTPSALDLLYAEDVLNFDEDDPLGSDSGVAGTARNYAGPYPAPVDTYPANAALDVLFSRDDDIQLTLADLDPNLTYDLLIYGSSNRAGITVYRVTGDSAPVEQSLITSAWTVGVEGTPNATDTVSFTGITPNANNEIILNLYSDNDTDPNVPRGFAVINTLVVTEVGSPLSPADLDGDGDVDDADFGIAFAAFTGPNNGPSSNPAADLDGDGDVDDADFGIAFAAFTGPGGAAVPEPASLALLGLGGLLIARRRRA